MRSLVGAAAPLGPPLSGCVSEVWLGRRDAMATVGDAILKNVATATRFEATLGLPKLKFGFDGDI